MAPAKKERGAPASAQRERPKKLTRKEKRALNIVKHRALQKTANAELRKEGYVADITRGKAHNAPVVQRADGKGRPTEYDEELALVVCSKFATDHKFSLVKLNLDPALPTVYTFYEWMRTHPDIEKAYARAREIQLDIRAEELEEWGEQALPGEVTVERDTPDGLYKETRRSDNTERTKIRIAVRQWLLSKQRPKKYGLQPLEVEGNDALKELLGAFRKRSAEIEDDAASA
jgi:hypothetical protein